MELYLEDCGKRQSFTKFTQFKTTWCGALQFEIKMATYKLIFVLWGVGISIHFVTEHALLLLLFVRERNEKCKREYVIIFGR